MHQAMPERIQDSGSSNGRGLLSMSYFFVSSVCRENRPSVEGQKLVDVPPEWMHLRLEFGGMHVYRD